MFGINTPIKSIVSKYIVSLLGLTGIIQGCSHVQSWQPVTITNSQQQIVHSTYTDKDYLIQVATIGDKPINGYPVIYVLDGNAFFTTSVAIAQLMRGRPNQASPKSLMVVGIGYPISKNFDIKNRTHDYTVPSANYPKPKGEQISFGGADKFHQFISQELTPILNQKFGINANHRTLFGHSYGGLFGLYALYRHSQDFDRYVIASPSIWWNDKSIQIHQALFTPTPNIAHALITLGEHELNAPHKNPDAPTSDLPNSDAYLTHQFLVKKLGQSKTSFAFHSDYSHGDNAYPSLLKGIRLAYQACQTDADC